MSRDMNTQVRDYTEFFQGSIDPVEMEEILHRRIGDGPVRPVGLVRSTHRRGWVTAAVAAMVTVIVLGSVAWFVGSDGDAPAVDETPPTTAAVTPTTEAAITTDAVEDLVEPEDPRLTEDIPPGVESGTFATAVGAARWVSISGDDSPLPAGGHLIAWPSGFAIFERPFNLSPPPAPVSRSAQLWVSDDGIEWRVQPLPLDPGAQDASLTLVEGVYWLLSSDPAGLWRSTDGANWDEIDSTGLLPPGPTGLVWFSDHEPPVTGGNLTLSHVSFEADLPFHDWLPLLIEDYEPFSDRDESCGTLHESEPGVFQIVGQEGDQFCPHQLALRFEETETGLRVLDNATGEKLGEVLGADLSHIDRLVQQGDAYSEENLLIIGDTEITAVETPWPPSSPTGGRRLQAMFGAQDSIYAYVRNDTGQVNVWRTSDGHSWTDLGPPSFLKDAPTTIYPQFTSLADSLTVTIFPQNSNTPPAYWETTDGVNWSSGPPPEGLPDDMYLLRLESGWFANDGSQGGTSDGDVWWMHAGDAWISLAELGIGRCDGANVTSADNTTFFFGHNSGRGCPHLWILNLDPSN
jgi:hypothetical protein